MTHVPVLLNEVLEYLDPRPGQFIIDGTVDGGGHATAILEKIGSKGTLLGLDLDAKMAAMAKKKIKDTFGSVNALILAGNYAELPDILKKERLPLADGLLLDLGFSSEQLESSGRGFSFAREKADEPLLMTYSDDRLALRDWLKRVSEQALADTIFQFSDERYSRKIAKAIVERERRKPMMTSGELADTVRAAVSKSYEKGRIDPATRTFQALRIFINGEFENLTNVLLQLPAILKPGGRAVIISFHSLEDRIVKQAFQKFKQAKTAILLTKKPIGATREEILQNPRARSAKLRALSLT